MNVRASSTNTSVTLQWELPEDLQLDEKTFYNVSFHAYVHVHIQVQLIKGQVNFRGIMKRADRVLVPFINISDIYFIFKGVLLWCGGVDFPQWSVHQFPRAGLEDDR